MKSKTEYLTFNALSRCAFINIMHKVAKTVGGSGVKEGMRA
jgi:thiamine phosphate synthase YjbQ (UPF0047 family)